MPIGLGIGLNISMRGGLASGFSLDAQTIAEDAEIGDLIGTFSGPAGPYTFTITADPDSKFVIGGVDDDELHVNGALDYETATSHSVTVQATLSDASTVSRVFSIAVTDVEEVPALELVLTWVSDNADLDPDFEVNYLNGTPAENDELTLSLYEDAGLTILHDSDTNILDAGEVSAGTITFGALDTLAEGVQYWAVVTMDRGADPTVTSNTETKTMAGVAVDGRFFPNRYFPQRYFPERYFG